jgi:signal transduction histidine kinase
VSLGHFHNAFRLCDESDQKNTKINILINIGNNYAKLNKPDIAIGYLKIADSLFDTFISPETRMNLDHSYSEVYQQLNDFEIALSYHIDYSKLKEEIFNQSTRKKIEELQTKYQLEKKIKETELWRLRNIELKKINDTKDKFFSIIAHDLRNPIQALLGLTTYFNDNINTLDDNDIKELTLDMKESSSLLNELVGNLLEWSQLQMGGLKLEPVNFDLFELISNNCKMLYHFAEEKHIKLRLDNDSSFMVYADKNMINTIIQNIIINAIKFSNNDSTVTINIVAKKTSCYVTIKDEGVGVDAKSKDKLFKIDSNISTPGTNNELGTGLGLILCKEFIELNKGYIQLDSELGKGTSVTITIPQNKNN